MACILLVASVFLSAPTRSDAKTSLADQLGKDPRSATPEELALAIRQFAANDPGDVHLALAEALGRPEPRPDCAEIAPNLVGSAIGGLPKPAKRQPVFRIVYVAVKRCPKAVLDTVRAAARAAEPDQAETIVQAAVAAVPDPYMKVPRQASKRTARATPTPIPEPRDFKGTADFKSTRDFKSFRDYKEPYDPGEWTLAEAIADAVYGSRDGLDYDALMAAADRSSTDDIPTIIFPPDEPRFPTPPPVSD